jgi:lysophospholipase L1-like esterase
MNRFVNLVLAVLTLLAAVLSSGVYAAEETGLLIVHNKGIGGQNSKQGRARFAKDVVALKPEYVFIYFGLNDTLNEPAFLSEKEYIENLTWMIDQAHAAAIKPVLCTIHRVGEEALMKRHKKESYGAEGPNGKIDRYNKALRAMAKEKQVPLADFAGVVAAAGADAGKIVSADGVHLTPAGYKALADCFFKVVAAEVKGKTMIVCLGDSVTFGAGVKGSGTTTGETYPAYLSQEQVGGR